MKTFALAKYKALPSVHLHGQFHQNKGGYDTFDEVVRKAVKSTQKVERLQRTAETDYGDRKGPFRLI